MKKLLLAATFILIGGMAQEAYSYKFSCEDNEKACTNKPGCEIIPNNICSKIGIVPPIHCKCPN